jgi:hypothetical protein
MRIAIWIFVALALIPYPFALFFYLIISPSGDRLDTGLTGFSMLMVLFNLGIAYLLVGVRYGYPWWSWILAVFVMLFYVASTYGLTELLKDQQPVRWMIVVPALGPLLILLYMALAAIPRADILRSPGLNTWILWGMIFALAMIPMQRIQALDEKNAERKVQSDQETAKWVALIRAHQEQYAQLPPDAGIGDLLPFLNYQETSYYALKRIVESHSKEAYFEEMMKSGDYSSFYQLYTFQLAPTPGLCECVREWLTTQASSGGRLTQKNSTGGLIPINSYLYTLQWFASRKCPMLEEVKQYEATLRSHPDTSKWTLEMLDDIKSKLQTP